MKTLKFTFLLLFMLMINSCTNKDEGTPQLMKNWGVNPFYQHMVWLSFQDAFGNDLLEGLGFDIREDSGQREFVTGTGERLTWDDGETFIYNPVTKEFSIVKLECLGGAVKPEFYTLDIVFEYGILNPWKPVNTFYVTYDSYPKITLSSIGEWSSFKAISDYFYLMFEASSYKYADFVEALLYGQSTKDCEFAEKITFRLTCPYIFGDNEAHDIVTWWELHEYYTTCYRIEYGGKELSVEEGVATIILDI